MYPESTHQGDEPGVQPTLPNAQDELSIDKMDSAEQLDGNLATDFEEERLAHSVVEADEKKIDEGLVVQEAFNQNLSSFLPDMMFKELVSNYKNAKKLYGETIIRELSGYDPNYIDKNSSIPEFQRELKKRLKDSTQELRDKGLLKGNGSFSQEALQTAALFLIEEEFLQHTGSTTSFGEHVDFAQDRFGEKSFTRPYQRNDPYRDVAMKHSISQALRRGHRRVQKEDFKSFEREARQQVNIVYALDTSGSMKGEKMRLAKKAGVALAHKAISDHNKVGLLLFGTQVQKTVPLTRDLFSFVKPLSIISPGEETDIALAIKHASRLLYDAQGVRHIVLLTDGLHTTSADPKKAVLEQVAQAKEQDITISIVGINLDAIGLDLAQHIVDHSEGRLHGVTEATDVGGVVIADYQALL